MSFPFPSLESPAPALGDAADVDPSSQRRSPAYWREVAAKMEGWPAERTLRWVVDEFGSRVTFATAFGAEGCVIIDLISRHKLPIDIFTLDTGLLFPETYAHWRRLEARYGLQIRAVRPAQTVEEQNAAHGPELWKRHPDRCCELRKMVPLREALDGFDAWIASIRRDQTPARALARPVEWDPRYGKVKVNPLLRWSSRDVWQYLREHDVPTNPLYEAGYASIGCAPCTRAIRPGEDARAGRWPGLEKTECGLHLLPTGGRA